MAATFTTDGKKAVIYDLASVVSRDWTALVVGVGEGTPTGEAVVLADLVECTLAGYARQTFGGVSLWSDGSSSDTVTINSTDGFDFSFDPYGGPPVTLNNMFVIDPTDDVILYYEVITPRVIDTAGDSFTLELTLGDNTLPLP